MGGAHGTARVSSKEVRTEPVQGRCVAQEVATAWPIPQDDQPKLVLVGRHLQVRFTRDPPRGTWHLERTDSQPRRATFTAMRPVCKAIVAELRSDLTQAFLNVPVRNASGLHLTHLPVFSPGNRFVDEQAYDNMMEVFFAVWGDEVFQKDIIGE